MPQELNSILLMFYFHMINLKWVMFCKLCRYKTWLRSHSMTIYHWLRLAGQSATFSNCSYFFLYCIFLSPMVWIYIFGSCLISVSFISGTFQRLHGIGTVLYKTYITLFNSLIVTDGLDTIHNCITPLPNQHYVL